MELSWELYDACRYDNVDTLFEAMTLEELKNMPLEEKNELLNECFNYQADTEFRVANILIDVGADINYIVRDENNYTMLYSVMNSLKDLYFMLLTSPEEEIHVYEQIRDVEFLLSKGANTNIISRTHENSKWQTCLDVALYLYSYNKKFINVVELLRKYGAKTLEELER